MNTLLWSVQAILAALFALAGTITAVLTKPRLTSMLPWVDDFSPATVRLIGIAELLGALGLILPAITGIATPLVPLAALGLAALMVAAAVVHARRREPSAIVVNAVLFAAAVLIAWGRFGPYAL
ncbi:hypothetical protein Afil01_29250 [Actinorhabdospora filicis]|uniref:DoxX family protein n=1 Tax=Actinorhabdospora filicis TaxID=1785913 RepID=A0A9W6SLD1_9ACTN|nr:DoxX family protein [Actinorhabdospora filicis]GLZ78118.1 hypothetical protein Afil01_29250 [Actinorhabdospora filicis]